MYLASLAHMANRADLNPRPRWLLLTALLISGCYVGAPIKPSELVLLDGYHDGEPKGGTVSVLSPANRPVEVAKNAEIYLDLPEGTYGGAFKSIQVSEGIFRGVTEEGKTVQVPLTSVQAARVRELNPGTWVLVTLVIVASAAYGLVYLAEHRESSAVDNRAP
jgi:hypothetical protein